MIRGLRGYYKNGQPITTANFGDVITYNVPGYSQIWLEQTVNGRPGYTGPFSVPMAPYQLRQGQDQAGQWYSVAYQYNGGQKGPAIESAFLQVSAPSGGTPQQGGVTPVTAGGGGGGGGGVNISAIIAPSISPGTPGAVPSGITSGQTPGGLSRVYRFVLQESNGYATGANYAGCSQTNSAMCDPQFFSTMDEVLAYAASRNEIPYRVNSADEPWLIIAGSEPIDSSRIIGSSSISMGTLALIGIGAYLLLRGRRSA